MNDKWPMVPLGQILKLQRRWVKLDALTDYVEIGVRSYGRGIFHKSPVNGAALGEKRVLRIEPGDLVFMNVFAWEGAVAVAGLNDSNKIGSHRFATYTPIDGTVDPHFLHLFFRTKAGRELLGRISPGSAGRNRTMNLSAFSAETVPLPPIAEQRRIVALAETVGAKTVEALALIETCDEVIDQLCRSIIFGDDSGISTPMREIVRRRPCDVQVIADNQYQFAGVYCFGRGLFRSRKVSGSEFAYRQLTTLRTGDFVYPKLMAWEGALATVPKECNGCVVSPEFPVFELNIDRVLPETLDVYFRTPSVWPQLSGASTGTNVRRKRLNPEDFLNHNMPLPSMSEQRKLAAVKATAEAIKQNHAGSIAELQALTPSVLDRAFRGEL